MQATAGSGRVRPPLIVAVLVVAVVAAVAVGLAAGRPSAATTTATSTVTAADALSGPATAVRTAVRLNPPEPRCERVWVIGDSLMVFGDTALRRQFDTAGVPYRVDARSGRRVSVNARPTSLSGVLAARSMRATAGEAPCWVIALGSNDLLVEARTASGADAVIEEMLAEVSPGARVWWVNVDHRRRPDTSLDMPALSRQFNQRLSMRASSDPDLAVVDWYSLAQANSGWFVDWVHLTGSGYDARARLIVDQLRLAGAL